MNNPITIQKDGMQIILRNYQKMDFGRIVELDKEAQINQEATKISLLSESDIKKVSPSNGGIFIVAEISHEVIGMGAMRRVDEQTCTLEYVRITPKYQNLGIGSELIKMIEERAKKLHYSKIECYTYQARKFYEKHGYEYIGQKEYPDGWCDSIMEKEI